MSAMQWLADLFQKRAEPQVVGFLESGGGDAAAGQVYLTIEVESLWITHIRKVLSKFYGAMYGRAELGNEEKGKIVFSVFDAVADAKELDAAHLDRIVQGPYKLVDAVPYRGGGVDVAMGLFSIKSADLAAPYLQLLKSVSKVAGAALLPQAELVANLVHEGATVITGGDSIEVGRHGHFEPIELGRYLVMRASPNEVKLSELRYDTAKRTLNRGEKIVTEYPYFILRLSAASTRDHFWDLPDLKEPFVAMKEQFRKAPTDYEANLKALERFRAVAELSPNLLAEHAKKLSDDVAKEYARFVTEGRRGATANGGALRENLKDFDPFT